MSVVTVAVLATLTIGLTVVVAFAFVTEIRPRCRRRVRAVVRRIGTPRARCFATCREIANGGVGLEIGGPSPDIRAPQLVAGWPGFNSANLCVEDKGQKRCAVAVVRAAQTGGRSPIPFAELMEVSHVTTAVAGALR